MKLVLIAGARPNFMKIAPILRAIKAYNEKAQNKSGARTLDPMLVHTGQHYDYEMSKVFFEDLELPEPDFHLGVGSGTHAEQTGKVMMAMEKVLMEHKPDLVVVVGDVNSTLASALAAVKLHIPVAHVEAGLRSFDNNMPEEINRRLTDAISDYLFTPSPDADENLKREGVPQEKIFLVGNVMVDSLVYNKPKAEKSDILERLGLITSHEPPVKPYALLTLHRPENVDSPESLLEIIKGIKEISQRITVIFPVHPRTRKRLEEFDLNLNPQSESQSNVLIIPPLGYLDFLQLMMNSKFVLTDSGGIQEETTILKVPCLTLRDTTERPITITQGTNVLVGKSSQKIIEEACKILDSQSQVSIPLWDGRAAERIVSILAESMRSKQ